jgi:hypothetical protein
MKEEYIPAPTRKAAALTVQTPRTRIIFMSTSGSAVRDSLRTQTTASSSPAASSPSTRPLVQPQAEPSLTAISSATSQADSRAAPTQLTRPGVLIGDSGTKSTVAITARTTAISGNQNSQW